MAALVLEGALPAPEPHTQGPGRLKQTDFSEFPWVGGAPSSSLSPSPEAVADPQRGNVTRGPSCGGWDEASPGRLQHQLLCEQTSWAEGPGASSAAQPLPTGPASLCGVNQVSAEMGVFSGQPQVLERDSQPTTHQLCDLGRGPDLSEPQCPHLSNGQVVGRL